MRAGVGIIGCVDSRVIEFKASGADAGVEIIDSLNTSVVGGHFETRVAVLGNRVKGLRTSGLTHDDQQLQLRPSPLAMLIRGAAHGDV